MKLARFCYFFCATQVFIETRFIMPNVSAERRLQRPESNQLASVRSCDGQTLPPTGTFESSK